jgi:hypothetical protein
MLRCKLDIADALARQQHRQAITAFADNINLFTILDFDLIMGIFNHFNRQDQALMRHVADIPLQTITNPEFKLAMQRYIAYLTAN